MNRAVKDPPSFTPPGSLCYRDGSPVEEGPGYHPHKSTRFSNYTQTKKPGRLPELYADRLECCGCTACVFACPVGAIFMADDEEGFEYPVVDCSACIGCGKCMEICVFKEKLRYGQA